MASFILDVGTDDFTQLMKDIITHYEKDDKKDSKMNEHEIRNKIINQFEIDYPLTFPRLIKILDFALSASMYSEDEFEEIIFTHYDVLDNNDEIDEDNPLWEYVRDIQHDIVNLYMDY